MSALRDFFQKEAEELLPNTKIQIVFWGDDPIDSVAKIVRKTLDLSQDATEAIRRRLATDEEFRHGTYVYDHLVEYNAGGPYYVIRHYNLGPIPVHVMHLNMDNTLEPLKRCGFLPPRFPDAVIDAALGNYLAFAHELAHPALSEALGITDFRDESQDNLHIKNALQEKYGLDIKLGDVERFEEGVADLFSAVLTARRLNRNPAEIVRLVSNIRMSSNVTMQAMLPSHIEGSGQNYASPLLDKAEKWVGTLPANLDARGLMEACIAFAAVDYNPAENVEKLFQDARKEGLFTRTVAARFVVAAKLAERARKNASLGPLKDFAARYVRAEKELLDICLAKETDSENLKQLRKIRKGLAWMLYPMRRLGKKARTLFGRNFVRRHGL